MNERILEHIITAPNLNDTHYASKLSGVFDNINDNFQILANKDFIKGEEGHSIHIETIELYNTSTQKFTEYGEKLKRCIETYYNDNYGNDCLADIKYVDNNDKKTVTLWDSFTENPGYIQMFFKTVIDENGQSKDIPVSSLNYVFLDGRFNKVNLTKIEAGEYDRIIDASCIIVFDNDDFKIIQNAFPTIYYEKGIGLCWKINGNNTGLPVRGIPGKDGIDADMFIVRANIPAVVTKTIEVGEVDNKKVYEYEYKTEISDVYDGADGYISANDFLKENALLENKFYTAAIFSGKDKDTKKELYFGSICKEKDDTGEYKLTAVFNSENSIDTTIQKETLINILKNIDITDNSKLQGLILPLENTVNEKNLQKVHILSATSITNNDGDSNLKADVVLTPINDINSLKIDPTTDNNLLVTKYLYLKLDKNTVSELCNDSNSRNGILSFLSKYNYILKYKLDTRTVGLNEQLCEYLNVNNINVKDVESFNSSAPIMSVTSNDICFAKQSVDKDNVTLNFITADTYKQDILDYIPENFNNCLKTGAGIYYWRLDTNVDSWDPQELLNTVNTENNDGNIENLYYCNEDKLIYKEAYLFKTLFTTSMTPMLTTEYMWFNGISINIINDKENDVLVSKYTHKFSEEDTDKTILFGWNYNNSNLFKFLKYIPIYNNSFSIAEDTSVNINYNVNITGDDKNNKKNLTVNGGINCVDLQVYSMSAASEIKNIYTRDNIVSEKGIILGFSSQENDDNTVYNCSTEINNGIVSTDKVISNNIDTIEIGATTIKNPFIELTTVTNMSEFDTDTNIIEGKINTNNINKISLCAPAGAEQYYKPNTDNTQQKSRATNFEPESGNTDINGTITLQPGFNNTGENNGTSNGNIGNGNNGLSKPTVSESNDDNVNEGFINIKDQKSLTLLTDSIALLPNTKSRTINFSVTPINIFNKNENAKIVFGNDYSDKYVDDIIEVNADTSTCTITVALKDNNYFENNKDIDKTTQVTIYLTDSLISEDLAAIPLAQTQILTVRIVNNNIITFIEPKDENILKIAEIQPVITSNIPYNSNNSPIIVSNTDMSSQQLCAQSISKQYYDGVKTQDFDGKVDYVRDVDFDNVKNFNINRLSMNSLGSKRDNILVNSNLNEALYLNSNKNYINNGYRKIFGKLHYGTYKNKTTYFTLSAKTEPIIITIDNKDTKVEPWIENYFNNTLTPDFNIENNCKKLCVYSYKLNKKQTENKTEIKLDRTKNIKFDFKNSIYNILLGIFGDNKKGSKPELNDSILKLNLLCCITDAGKTKTYLCNTKTLNIPATKAVYGGYIGDSEIPISDGDITGVFTGNTGPNNETSGNKATYIKSDNRLVKITGNRWSSDDWQHRYSSLFFKMNNFVINSNTETFKNIADAFDAGNTIDFYIVPEFCIVIGATSGSTGRRQVHQSVLVTQPLPVINYVNRAKVKENEVYFDVNGVSGNYNSENNCTTSYNYVVTKKGEQENIKSTTIVNNGIVMRDGNYTFGLGYSNQVPDYGDLYKPINPGAENGDTSVEIGWNHKAKEAPEPILFYHEYKEDIYKVDNGMIDFTSTDIKHNDLDELGNPTNSGFVKRTYAIPLKDIFEVVKHYKTTGTITPTEVSNIDETDWSNYGL